MKTCRTCQLDQPLDAFHRDPRNSDGRTVRCRACVGAQRAARKATETPAQRAERLARQRVYTARSRALHPDKPRPYGPGRRERDPMKTRARSRLRWALDHGMPRPAACSSCGQVVDRLHGHHHRGYEAEHWLDVVWLCSPCHAAVHRDLA